MTPQAEPIAAPAPADPRALYLRGCALVLLAGLFWSFTGTLVRLAVESDAWQYLLWRCAGAAAFFALASLRAGRGLPFRDLAKLGWLGAFASAVILGSSVSFIVALKSTAVANALFLSACAPLLTGLLAYLLIGEKLSSRAVLAILVGFCGVVLMIGNPAEGAGSRVGDLLAFAAAFFFAFYNVCLRIGRDQDFSPTMFAYALGGIALSALVVVANGKSLFPPPFEIAVAFFNGFAFIGIGSALFIKGSVHVPAAGLAVLAQTEAVFGPLWAALFIGEVPGRLTVAGGVLILAAAVAMAISGAQRPPPNIATG